MRVMFRWSTVSDLLAKIMVLVWDVIGHDLRLQKITNGWVGRLNDCWCWDDKPRQLRHFIICSLSNCEAATKILERASFHHCGHNGAEKRSQLCHSFSNLIISVMVHLIKTDEGVWVEPFGSWINAAHHNYKQNPSNETVSLEPIITQCL
jgi:hypothetical protein